MGNTDKDFRFGLDNIKQNLILVHDHYKKYQCPFCLTKHWTTIQAYADEILPMTKDEKLRNFLLKLSQVAESKRKELGDVLAE